MQDDKLRRVLFDAGLEDSYERFLEENIDFQTLANLTSEELSSLGVSRIGDQARLRRAISSHISPPPPNSDRFSWGPHLTRKMYEEEFGLKATSPANAWDQLMTFLSDMSVLDRRDGLIVVTTGRWWESKVVIGFRTFVVEGNPRFAVRVDFPAIGWDAFKQSEYFVGKLLGRLESEQGLEVERDPRPARMNPFVAMTLTPTIISGSLVAMVILWNNFGPGSRGKQLAWEVCACFSDIKDKQDDGEIPLGVGNFNSELQKCYSAMSANSSKLASDGGSGASNDDIKNFAEIVQKCAP